MVDRNTEKYKKDFAERLSHALAIREKTQKAVCEQIGFSEKAMCELHRGKRRPHMSTVKLIAEALDVDYEWLLIGNE